MAPLPPTIRMASAQMHVEPPYKTGTPVSSVIVNTKNSRTACRPTTTARQSRMGLLKLVLKVQLGNTATVCIFPPIHLLRHEPPWLTHLRPYLYIDVIDGFLGDDDDDTVEGMSVAELCNECFMLKLQTMQGSSYSAMSWSDYYQELLTRAVDVCNIAGASTEAPEPVLPGEDTGPAFCLSGEYYTTVPGGYLRHNSPQI